MNELTVAYKLGYNLDYYKYYIEYKEGCPDNEYLSYENYLILSNNLERLIDGADLFSEYVLYHEDLKVQDYECFELFCKTMHLFPYDISKLEEYKDCSNCIYFSEGFNLKTKEEEYVCMNGEDFNGSYDLDCHVFRENAADEIVKRLRKQRNNNKHSRNYS